MVKMIQTTEYRQADPLHDLLSLKTKNEKNNKQGTPGIEP